jgi:signal transduction histidine kinase
MLDTAFLAPPPKSLRSLRYRGDDRAVRISEMSPTDRDGVRALYEQLGRFHAALAGAADPAAVVTAFDYDAVMTAARTLGRGEGIPEAVRRALHDVRGGALTSLLVSIQRFRTGRATDAAAVKGLEVLASDHLKILRNAVLELDDPRREADLAPCPHVVGRLADSLSRVTGDGPDGPIRVDVACTFTGAITMSCVELGALDRATLNLVNNAVRYAAASPVEVALVPVPGSADPDLRVVVANRIDDARARALEERFGDDLGRIFVEAFSTTGSGDGLKICVEFAAAAYGFARPEDAAEAGVVGATIREGSFVAWVHWPAVA